jgi:opacity protein-like surface antigen
VKKFALVLIAAGVFNAPTFAEDAASPESLQHELDTLKTQMQQLQRQLDTTTEQQKKSAAPAPDATPAVQIQSDTTFGGYGEIAYNDYRKDSSRNQADLRRFVLFLGHRFNERLTFNSEVEWEHAVTSATDQGESEIEQAYLNYVLTPSVNLKTGLFLMPFGFLNESHEPPVYYGVERNFVETRIIPSTWREGGLGLHGSTDLGLAWDAGVTTGFNVSKFDDPSAPLASMHQELQFAQAHDLALYGALNYRGVPGLTVGSALFSGNSAQGNAAFKADNTQPDFSGINARVTLWDVHTRWQAGGADLQALYAKGKIGDADRIDQTLQAFNTANPLSPPRAFVPDEFYGWLVQAAYMVWQREEMSLTPFIRYERYNTQSSMPEGFAADPANADRVTTAGLSFKPHPQVVFKADYQKFKDNTRNDRFNLGLGYMF